MLVGSMGTAFELGQPLLPVGLRTFNSDSGLVEVLCLNLVYSDSMEHLGPGVSDSPLLLIFVFSFCFVFVIVICSLPLCVYMSVSFLVLSLLFVGPVVCLVLPFPIYLTLFGE